MKKTLIILSTMLLNGCVDNKKNGNKSITREEEKKSIETNLEGPINIKHWDKTPSINGRVATQKDVANGIAVYSAENGGPEHKVYKTQLPKLAYLVDSESKKEELVVVIQIEDTRQGILSGYRNLDGGYGVCFLYELKFLDEQKVREILDTN